MVLCADCLWDQAAVGSNCGKFWADFNVISLYYADRLDRVVSWGHQCDRHGLTLGIHTRIDATAQYIATQVRTGNVSTLTAPSFKRNGWGSAFMAAGLSGTGPKAGGPHYLLRFATNVPSPSTPSAAEGGNASSLGLTEDP